MIATIGKENCEPKPAEDRKEPVQKEEKKDTVSKADSTGTEKKAAGLIVVGRDVGKGKLQKRFEKFRAMRMVLRREGSYRRNKSRRRRSSMSCPPSTAPVPSFANSLERSSSKRPGSTSASPTPNSIHFLITSLIDSTNQAAPGGKASYFSTAAASFVRLSST